MSQTSTFEEFMDRYGDPNRQVIEIDVPSRDDAPSPFIVIRSGRFTAIVNPLQFTEYLDIDVHSFVDGKDSKAGVMAMSEGQRFTLEDTGSTSEPGWPSASLVAVFIGDPR